MIDWTFCPIGDEAVRARIRALFDLRAKWSDTHNLAGPKALASSADDVLDGLAVTGVLARGFRLVDVGAGSGVPGLVVACINPEVPVTLVEPSAKRTAFLRTVANQLGLKVQIIRNRWPIALAERSQVVSRAVVDPTEWPGLAVEGGDFVTSVIRMLAVRRPPWPLPGFNLAAEHDYEASGGALRRVERWDRAVSRETLS